MEFGYHLTENDKLYGIKKSGLQPKLGLRSNNANECVNRVYFSTYIEAILCYWIYKLYDVENIDNLVILKFPINDLNYYFRDGQPLGRECCTNDIIPASKIKVITLHNISLRDEYYLPNMDLEINVDENMLIDKLVEDSIRKKANYFYDIICNYASINKYILSGSLLKMLENHNPYESVSKYDLISYKNDIESIYYTIIDSLILDKYDISEEYIYDYLTKLEYERKQDFNYELLASCNKISNESYVIPDSFIQVVKEKEEILKNSDYLDICKNVYFMDDIVTYSKSASAFIDKIKKESKNKKILEKQKKY